MQLILRLLAGALALALASSASAQVLRVVDEEGRPVASARVILGVAAGERDPLSRMRPPLGDDETDASGSPPFRIPLRDKVRLVIDAPGFAPVAQEMSPRPGDLQVVLRRGQTWRRKLDLGAGQTIDPGTACASWSEKIRGFDRPLAWKRCAEVSTAGEFTLSGLGAGTVDLDVEIPGFLSLKRTVGVGSAAPLKSTPLKLRRGTPLSGRIVGPGPSGSAVVKAVLSSVGSAPVESRAGGSFRIAVASLPATLKVAATGFRPQTVTAKRGRSGPLMIVLDRGEEIRGILVDEQRRPFAKAHVWLERGNPGEASRAEDRNLVTERGAFVLPLPGPGKYLLRIQAEGAQEETLPAMTISPGESRALGALVLHRGAGVEGVVIDARTGDPLPGVDLELTPEGAQILDAVMHQQITRGVSDPRGRFSLTGFRAGQFVLTARRSGFALAQQSETLAGDRVVDLGNLPMEHGTLIHGTVLDRSGTARKGATVKFFGSDPSSLIPIEERTTTEEGTFEGPLLASGRYRVQVWSARLLLSQTIDVPRGQDEWPLELTAGGVHLTGLITRAGEPVDGGSLSLQSSLEPSESRGKIVIASGDDNTFRLGFPETRLTADVQKDGTFEVSDAPSGALRVNFVGQNGAAPVTRAVDVPDSPEASIDIEVGGLTLKGRLIDRAQNTGLEGNVRITDSRGSLFAAIDSDADGSFEASDLPAGRYTLAARSQGYVPRALAGVEAGPATPPVEIALEKGDSGSLAVRLTRPDGSPSAWVQLTLQDATGRMVQAQPTDSSGAERFTNVPAGRYVLIWSDSFAGTGASEPFDIESGHERSYERTLTAGSAVTLHCALDQCGGQRVESFSLATASGAEIAPYLAGMSAGLSFSKDGELSLGRLSPGSYLLKIAAHGRTWTKTLNVDSGDERVGLP